MPFFKLAAQISKETEMYPMPQKLCALFFAIVMAGNIIDPVAERRGSPEPPPVQTAASPKISDTQPTEPNPELPIPQPEPPPRVSVRTYKTIAEGDEISGEITHYCACEICNGKGGAGITADGTRLDGNTPPIVGCNWLALGAVVEVGGMVYRVADRGGKGFDDIGRLDVYVPDGHEAAQTAGRKNVVIKVVWLP
jgi:3D (Asp-Asp-Asp) domain-containing protein